MGTDMPPSSAYHGTPTPALELEEFDLSTLGTIKDQAVLAKLVRANKISQVDYRKAIAALCRKDEPPPRLEDIQILYSATTPPVISPAEVLERLQRPIRTADAIQSFRVDKISDTVIVKYGRVLHAELETMLFVKQHTRIPVPTVHLLFVLGEDTYLVMEYIPGGDLQHLWPSLQEAERQLVLSQLQQYLHDLHAITPPSTIPGPIGGGVCRGCWFSEFGAGPFKSHQELVEWWNSKLPPADDPCGNPSDTGERLQADHPLVFTHGDIAPRNLILRDGVVWVLDWEQAGWYPAYLEYAFIASETGSWEDPTPKDWKDAMLSLIPHYKREHEILIRAYPRIARGFDPILLGARAQKTS
ncbi:hypothetical protein GSI_13023 [Ganoderma sinense ZZ0214-1]|uniref:Aminoglycoside phosphotransferase domain-containing protein n=1 Tax=Ganoderma sinense ZZ0214-1 TaxID=1077348 RepID=A0A2G8RUH9_9APHY|nr:hypothetical protein GSI_13023 [Ganoderma sinense ZZ0214-1]